MLTFAIKPNNFVDDGEAAYQALKARIEAEKKAKKAARRAAKKLGIALPEDDEVDEED